MYNIISVRNNRKENKKSPTKPTRRKKQISSVQAVTALSLNYLQNSRCLSVSNEINLNDKKLCKTSQVSSRIYLKMNVNLTNLLPCKIIIYSKFAAILCSDTSISSHITEAQTSISMHSTAQLRVNYGANIHTMFLLLL